MREETKKTIERRCVKEKEIKKFVSFFLPTGHWTEVKDDIEFFFSSFLLIDPQTTWLSSLATSSFSPSPILFFLFSRHVIVLVGVILVPLHVVAINQRLDALLQISRLKKQHKNWLSIILEKKKQKFPKFTPWRGNWADCRVPLWVGCVWVFCASSWCGR